MQYELLLKENTYYIYKRSDHYVLTFNDGGNKIIDSFLRIVPAQNASLILSEPQDLEYPTESITEGEIKSKLIHLSPVTGNNHGDMFKSIAYLSDNDNPKLPLYNNVELTNVVEFNYPNNMVLNHSPGHSKFIKQSNLPLHLFTDLGFLDHITFENPDYTPFFLLYPQSKELQANITPYVSSFEEIVLNLDQLYPLNTLYLISYLHKTLAEPTISVFYEHKSISIRLQGNDHQQTATELCAYMNLERSKLNHKESNPLVLSTDLSHSSDHSLIIIPNIQAYILHFITMYYNYVSPDSYQLKGTDSKKYIIELAQLNNIEITNV